MGFCFSIEKSVIGASYIQYLGHYLGQGRCRPGTKTIDNLEKIKTTSKIDAPFKTWQKIIGFFNYSRKYIKFFARDSKLVRKYKLDFDLITSDKKLIVENVEKLKTDLQNKIDKIIENWCSTIKNGSLTIPNAEDKLELATDASKSGIGYILRVVKTGAVVEFGGRELKPEESRYSNMERELLAAAEGLEKTKIYVLRCPKLKLLVDNQCAIAHIKSPKIEVSTRAYRFILRIQQFPNIEPIYIRTTENTAADMLSRSLLQDTSTDVETNKSFEQKSNKTNITNSVYLPNYDVTSSKITEVESESITENENFLLEDYKIQHVIFTFYKCNDSSNWTWNHSINTLKNMSTCTRDIDIENTIKKVHDEHGHLCERRLIKLLKILFPSLHYTYEQVSKILRKCKICLEERRLSPANNVGRMKLAKKPNETIHIDHFSPFPTSQSRHVTILTLRDAFSKFICLFPSKTYGHEEIKANLKHYFTICGFPKRIRADNALISHSLTTFCQSYGIELIATPVYRPQSNGTVERCHRDLRKLMPLILKENNIPINRWPDIAPIAAQIINNSPHSVLGTTPAQVHLGQMTTDIAEARSYDPKLAEKWSEIYKKLENAQDKMETKISGPFKETKIEPNTLVYLNLPSGKIKARVIEDLDKSLLVKKIGEHSRFALITVHKSKVSLCAPTEN